MHRYQAFPQPNPAKSDSLTTVLCDLPHVQVRTRKTSGYQQPIHNRQRISPAVGSSPTYPPAFSLPGLLSMGSLHSPYQESLLHREIIKTSHPHFTDEEQLPALEGQTLSSWRVVGLSPGIPRA